MTVREELIRDLEPLDLVRNKESLSVRARFDFIAALLLSYGWYLARPPKRPRKVHAWCKYGNGWLRFERLSWVHAESPSPIGLVARTDMFYDGNSVKFVEVDS